MTQEEKELLLKDISARLLYGVKIQVYYEEIAGSGYFDETVWTVDNDEPFHVNDRWIENIKPYLFPLSSMSGKQYVEFVNLGNATSDDCFDDANFNQLDWLNANYFDYRGLIEKGLAIDATGLNIY